MTITYNIFNSIDSSPLVEITMPWDYRRAVKGFYSDFWKAYRRVCASNHKLEKQNVRAAITRNKIRTNRGKITLPSGTMFDFPFDMNTVDFKIVNLHLDALSLSRGGGN